jgi:hypothetical protein
MMLDPTTGKMKLEKGKKPFECIGHDNKDHYLIIRYYISESGHRFKTTQEFYQLHTVSDRQTNLFDDKISITKTVDRCPCCQNKKFNEYQFQNKEKPIKVIKKITFPTYDIRIHVCLQCKGAAWETIERPVSCRIEKEENDKVKQIQYKLAI